MEKRYEKIPIEVIVKFNEKGEMKPIKFIYLDEIYAIDLVYGDKIGAAPGTQYAVRVFNCLIKGKKKAMYYDKYANVWFISKEIKEERNYINISEIDGA